MCVKKDSKESSGCCEGARTTREIGIESLLKLCFLHVLQHHPLRALFFHYPFIVREVERGGLHAAIAFTRTEDLIDYPDRRCCP